LRAVAGDAGSILVVEDDAALRMVCRVALELEGFSVREAEGVEAARTLAGAQRPDLVFLDVTLGAGSCDALLDELRDDEIPVVVVSGDERLSAYRSRASGVLAKPFAPVELVAAARQYALG
jgi:DNA-binding response OmpR family regulator